MNKADQIKLTPRATDIEEIVLGAILLSSDDFTEVSDILTPDSFYDDKHKYVYEAIVKLAEQNSDIDILTVTNQVKKDGKLEIVGGAYFISQLTNRVASSANIESHAMILKQYQMRRDVISLSQDLLEAAYDDTNDSIELVDYLMSRAVKVSDVGSVNEVTDNIEIIKELSQRIEYAQKHQGVTGTPCGFTKIDSITGGWQPTDLIIKAGRPGMGKTAEVLAEANHIANHEKKYVAFFSLEMSKIQLMQRLVSMESGIPLQKLRDGDMSQQDWSTYHSTIGRLSENHLKIFDRTFNLWAIIKQCKKLKLAGELDIIIIDYLQLIEHFQRGASRENIVSYISRALKMLAKELNVPVVCLSQLSRAVEQRGGDKKPILSDLRESGSIEQDADIVQFIYRPEYYGIEHDADGESTLGAAYVLTAKNRHGAVRDVKLRFKGECVAFEEWTEDFERPNIEDVYNPNAGMTPDNSFSVSSQDAKEYEEPPF